MTTETVERETKRKRRSPASSVTRAHEKIFKKVSWALAIGFVVVIVALGLIGVESYRTSKREAGVFASVSGAAFEQGLCDRA